MIHNTILKKLIPKKCDGVMIIRFENLTWIKSTKNESENKKMWILNISWLLIASLKIWANNRFIQNEIIHTMALLFVIIIYCFLKHVIEC